MIMNRNDWSKARARAEQLADQLGCCLLGVSLALEHGRTRYFARLLLFDEELKVELTA